MSVRGEIEALVKAKADQASINNATQALMKLKSGLTKMLGAIGIGISLVQLNAIAEEFNGINDQINHAIGNAENMKEVQRGILDAANNCRTSYAQMASSVVALKQANSKVFPIEDATKFVETLTKVGKVAGYSDGQISAMSNVMQRVAISGTMGANDLLRAARQAPELLDTIAKGLGVERKELDKMAASGKLTAETIKTAVLNAESDIQNSFDQLDYSISDGLLHIRNRWGYWVDDMNSTFHISETIAKVMVTAFEKVMTILEKVRKGLVDFSKKVGGTENLFKLITIAAAAFFLVMNWGKITQGVTTFISFLKKIPSLFSAANLKVLALVGVIILLALIVEDFINFMKGNDSVIGYCFQRAGIDAEEMRQKVTNIMNNLKEIFLGIWNGIQKGLEPILDAIKAIISSIFGEDIFAGVGEGVAGFIEGLERLTSKLAENKALLEGIGKVVAGVVAVFALIKIVVGVFMTLTAVLGPVAQGIGAVFSVLAALNPIVLVVIAVVAALIAIGVALYKNWDTVKAKVAEAWNAIGNAISAAGEFIVGVVTGFCNACLAIITGIWNIIVSILTTTWFAITSIVEGAVLAIQFIITSIFNVIVAIITGLWNGVVSFFTAVWTTMTSLVSNGMNAIHNTVSSILNAILGFFQAVFSSIVSAVTSKMAEVSNAIINGFNSAVSFIQGLIGMAYSWGADLIGNIASGIRDGIGAVVDAASSVASAIKGALGHSVPTEGPLKDELTWMPDMMQNIATGIDRNRYRIKNAINRAAGDLNIMANAQMVSGATAGAAAGAITNNRSINQNVDITNQFYGDRAIQQRAASAMGRSAQDITAQLARGLAYVR